MSYPHEERAKARDTIKRLEKLTNQLQQVVEGRRPPNPQFQAAMSVFTGRPDVENQFQVMHDRTARARANHMNRLIATAPNDLTAYAEAMNPDEPPPKHLIYVSEMLMEVESAGSDLDRLLLSMPPGHAKDLDVDTPVMMGDGGWKRLGDVMVGDMVMTMHGRPREVLAVHDQGTRPVYKIVTEKGRTIRAHGEHLFLTPADWIAAEDLRAGSVLAVPREFASLPVVTQGPITSARRDDFVFTGYMIARAVVSGRSYNKIKRVNRTFRCDDPAVLADIKDVASRLGFRGRQTMDEFYGQRSVKLTFDMRCKDWLQAKGLYEADKETVRVPSWVFQGSAAEIGAFLGAIIACDAQFVPQINKHTGSQRKVMLQIKNNEGLARDLQRLFMRIGVNVEFHASACSNYNYDHVTFFKLQVKDATNQSLIARRCRIVGSTKRLWSLPLIGTGFVSEAFHSDAVLSVVKDGDAVTRCLTVDEDQSFLADGIIVHNSTYGSRYMPSWYLGRKENRKWLQAGHTQDFVAKEFGRKTRDLVNQQVYRDIFPGVLVRSDSSAADNWRLTNGNEYIAKGVGQAIAGVRSTFNGVDDPYPDWKSAQSPLVRNETWNWFAIDFMARLLPMGRAVIIMTRWHLDDICGRIIDGMSSGQLQDHWEVINLPVVNLTDTVDVLNRKFNDLLWPEFYTQQDLDRRRALTSEIQWQCLYMGDPVPEDGSILKRQYFVYSPVMPMKRYDFLQPSKNAQGNTPNTHQIRQKAGRFPGFTGGDPQNTKQGGSNTGDPEVSSEGANFFYKTVVSVDTAETEKTRSDYTAITVWRQGIDGNHYLMYCEAERWAFPALVDRIEEVCQLWGADILLMETKGAGTQYIQQVSGTGTAPCEVIPITPGSREGKIFRMDGASLVFKAKRVIFPQRAPWLAALERELLTFPGSVHDDRADSVSQYLTWVQKNLIQPRGAMKLTGMSHAKHRRLTKPEEDE